AIPTAMTTGTPYTQQFAAAAAAASQLLGRQDYRLAYQSQATGTPFPWLQPDINDAVQQVHTAGYRDVIVAPIGFLCDHVEVLYDLDVQAREVPLEVILLEASGRLGGTIATHTQDGLLMEQGPDCFLSAKPWGVRLCEELGLGDEFIGTTTQYRQSFIVRGGRLVPVPQ